jgi:hypothetical protein
VGEQGYLAPLGSFCRSLYALPVALMFPPKLSSHTSRSLQRAEPLQRVEEVEWSPTEGCRASSLRGLRSSSASTAYPQPLYTTMNTPLQLPQVRVPLHSFVSAVRVRTATGRAPDDSASASPHDAVVGEGCTHRGGVRLVAPAAAGESRWHHGTAVAWSGGERAARAGRTERAAPRHTHAGWPCPPPPPLRALTRGCDTRLPATGERDGGVQEERHTHCKIQSCCSLCSALRGGFQT